MLAIAPRCSSRTAASLLILALLSLLPLPLQAASRPVHVLATTYPVWQLARPLVAGLENVRLDLLIPAATGCPHDYAPTPADLTKVATADVILMNGLGLEAAFAPALAQADVAVAMNTGTQAAKEAGNMVDLDSSPTSSFKSEAKRS